MPHKERLLEDIYSNVATIRYIFDHPIWGRVTDQVRSGYPHPRMDGLVGFLGHQVTDDETHPEWKRKKRGVIPSDSDLAKDPYGSDRDLFDVAYTGNNQSRWLPKPTIASDYDVGGPFRTVSVVTQPSNPREFHYKVSTVLPNNQGKWTTFYDGPVYCCWPQHFCGMPDIGENDLSAEGTTAIARCKPTNNVANAAQALLELFHEGVPDLLGATLWKEKSRLAKKAGREYLNKEFGWDPLVADIRNVAYAAANAHKILSQYERDSGKVVRRGWEFPLETSTSTDFIGEVYPAFAGGAPWDYIPGTTQQIPENFTPYTGTSSLYRRRQTSRRVWFSGAFTYYLPADYNSRFKLVRYASHAEALLGLEMTPETLWNVAPWTWAMDWFSNVGDVVANLSSWSSDGLVLKYGYIMEHTIVHDEYYIDPEGGHILPNEDGYLLHPSSIRVTYERKRRERATPFGFEVDWSGLSPRQWAISVALGLSKGFRQ